jgi:hypothetical protein
MESKSSDVPFYAAYLQSTPHYQNWESFGLLHVTGAEIVPSSVYRVELIAANGSVSPTLEVRTTRWGDVVGATYALPPQGRVNFDDISSIIAKFKSAPGAPIKARALLAWDIPVLDPDFTFLQVSAVVDAFKGIPFALNAPTGPRVRVTTQPQVLVSLKAVKKNGVAITPTNDITVAANDTITAELRFSGWGHPNFDASGGNTGLVNTYQVQVAGLMGVQSSGPGHGLVLPIGWDAPLIRDIPPCNDPLYPVPNQQYGCVGLNFHPELMASIDWDRTDFLLAGFSMIIDVAVDSLDIKWGGDVFDANGYLDSKCAGGTNAGGECFSNVYCPGGTCQPFVFYGGRFNLKAMPASVEAGRPAMCGTFTFNLVSGSNATFIANPLSPPDLALPALQSLVLRGPTCPDAPSPSDQLTLGVDLQPDNKVTLDHLWQWDPNSGRFVDPGPAGVSIDPTKPTYLLTHGWDGDLNTFRSMSSIGCAIWQAKGNSVNLIAWDWARDANPNGRDDLGILLANGNVELLIKLGAFCAGRLRMNTLTSAYFFGIGDAVADALISGVNARYQGIVLGRALARELERPGGALGTELHFIGKSHGGGLLGQAAQILKLKHPVTSLTTLDTPHVLCDGTGCLIDSLAYVDPSAALHTAVFYYSERVADILVRYVAGLGAPGGPDHSRLTNVALNPFLVPWKWPVQILHLWISGPDGGVDGACPPEDGWFPLNAWDDQASMSPPLRFLPPSPSPAYSLLNVPGFPAGNWEERDPYTFVSLTSGACCTDSFVPCHEEPEVDCDARGGEYQGNGTTCVDSDSQGGPDLCETTPPPTGACCNSLFPTGPFWCDQRTRSWCTGPGYYNYHGDGTQCDTDSDGFQDICGTLAVTAGGEPTLPTPNPAPGMSLLRYEPFQSAATWFGNLTQLVIGADPDDATNRVILMQEQGDASFFKDIDWAADAVVITFDYMFREPRGGENLTVYRDNQIVYYDNAEISLAHDHLTSSGAIYVGNVAGLTKRLNFVFRTDQPEGGTLGGELVIDNVRVYGFLEADADLDGDRDLADFATFQRCFGASPMPDECWAFDVNGDDGVDIVDYAGDAADPPQFRGFVEFIADPTTGGPKTVPTP